MKTFLSIQIYLFLALSLMGQSENLPGISFMHKIQGVWYGPVYSSSSAGSFDAWYMDFRPIGPSEIAQFSMLDSNTINNMFFFVCEFNGELRIAMRTEGCFQNQCCVTYELLDSVNEEAGYYRFSDVVAGDSRAYTEFVFSDSTMMMQVYTTKFGGITVPALHTRLNAVRGDAETAGNGIDYWQFPQQSPKMDLSKAFDGKEESIFYSYSEDVYEPFEGYLSSVTINIELDADLSIKKSGELFILLCTQSMYDGLKLKKNYHDYYSRYLFLPEATRKYTLKNVHPGTYYLYSFSDPNGDRMHLSGDLMSSDPENIIVLKPGETIDINTRIDMVIP